ncbi:penicillin-binding protein 2 [Paenisporosarcina sp. TG20]|uniref:peptidoglycan D,D-transpeptidase FtsI family protein n=1 Tax=Paenisporosarcina sp. TG20 TaxID=1211706 RepID=UPI0002FB123E|nr:penicillin-binding protein 2 [Paenisporosarcina sp. TG20]
MRKISKKRAASAKAKLRTNTVFRMNILFFTIFLLFSILILRLGFLQIVQGEEYVRTLERTEEVSVNSSVPRGRIYDSVGRVLVDNEPKNAITYTKLQTTKQGEMLTIAKKLATMIVKKTDSITTRDKQDHWIRLNLDAANEKVSTKEKNKLIADELSQSDIQRKIDAMVRERITEEELASITEQELEVLAIYREMSSGYALSPQIITSDNVTPEEFARVSEHLGELNGVNTTTDWVRVPMSTLSILGRTTSPTEGIPKDSLSYFLARNYSRNDRVGKSNIEQQYEEILQGQKSVVKNITNGKGTVKETQTVFEGQPGKDLVLTIDSEMQAKMESLVEAKMVEMKRQRGSHLLDRTFVVILDPNTGEVLSIVGKQFGEDPDTGKRIINDYAFGTFTSAYEIGSTIKPATVLTGYDQGVIQMNETMIDEPITIAGSNPKSSVFNRNSKIAMTDLEALERSSNVYMFKIGFRLANAIYRYKKPIDIDSDAYGVLRNSYSQFGLGVTTGIDLPNESAGITGGEQTEKFLDLTIGQFDTYTPLQMAQYVSTIANDGYRIKPHVVKEIRDPSTDGVTMGPLVTEIGPTVLNRINNTQAQIDQIKRGMNRVYFGSQGSAKAYFGDAPYDAAGKTGSAEVVYRGPNREYWGNGTIDSINSTHIGFAPYNNPEIAYAVVIPWAPYYNGEYESTATILAREVVDAYFALKKKNGATEEAESTTIQSIKPAFSDTIIEEDIEN